MNAFRFALFFVVATAGSSVAVNAAAQAVPQANPADSPLYFPNVDKNRDGMISRSEVPGELKALHMHFDQYDADHDHRLSEAEYVAFLTTLNQTACRENEYTQAKCAHSPYAMGSPTMGVSPDNAPKRLKQGQ